MNLRRPWVLLLAGVLAASGSGCATYTALTSSSPRAAASTTSAERLVSIGRTFENQGRYDQAEVMYRKALRIRPADETIQLQLQQLADRRAGRNFGADPMMRALAMADAVSGSSGAAPGKAQVPEAPAARPAEIRVVSQQSELQAGPATDEGFAETVDEIVGAASLTAAGSESLHASVQDMPPASAETDADEVVWQELAPLPPAVQEENAWEDSESTVELSSLDDFTGATVAVAESRSLQATPATVGALESAVHVTVEDLLIASENLDASVDTLIAALEQNGDIEARTLAAALLGDCQAKPAEIAFALANALASVRDEGLLLAIADSQVQRGIANELTAEVLRDIAANDGSPFQIQAVSSLRYFAASSSAEACQKELSSLLANDSQEVRAAAVLTLGDFKENAVTLSALKQLAAEDIDVSVREAAHAAIERRRQQATTLGRASL